MVLKEGIVEVVGKNVVVGGKNVGSPKECGVEGKNVLLVVQQRYTMAHLIYSYLLPRSRGPKHGVSSPGQPQLDLPAMAATSLPSRVKHLEAVSDYRIVRS